MNRKSFFLSGADPEGWELGDTFKRDNNFKKVGITDQRGHADVKGTGNNKVNNDDRTSVNETTLLYSTA